MPLKLLNKNIAYKLSGAIGIFGCFSVLATDVIGIAVHEAHNPIKNTISMLAIGKYGWIQDLGLDLLAIGFLAVAFGFFTLKRSGTKWSIGLIFLVMIAINLILIAEHNQYAGRPGYKIHRKLVYSFTLLFPALLLLVSSDLKKIHSNLKKISQWIAGLWIVLAPLMPLIPSDFKGAYERLVSLLIVIWLSIVSYRIYQLSKTTDNKTDKSQKISDF